MKISGPLIIKYFVCMVDLVLALVSNGCKNENFFIFVLGI